VLLGVTHRGVQVISKGRIMKVNIEGRQLAAGRGRHKRNRRKKQRDIYILGMCRLGLVVIAVAHVMLAAGTFLALATPWSAAGKVVSFIGYILLCGLVLIKVRRAIVTANRQRSDVLQKS
jgi:hypothetical protein